MLPVGDMQNDLQTHSRNLQHDLLIGLRNTNWFRIKPDLLSN